jgi:SAM-dependent methyltransferase
MTPAAASLNATLGADGVEARRRAARIARKRGDFRTEEQILEHYRIERELADRLRHAPAAERGREYRDVYDELFRRVPHHPQLQQVESDAAAAHRDHEIEQDLAFLRRFLEPGSVYMEIGAGDCVLTLRIAEEVAEAHAVEVSETITRDLARPDNFELHLTDGTHIPLSDGTVTVAFSDQLIEHLHPEDARAQLGEVCRVMAPGGVLVCITPNRLYGPRDVSEYFDERATGLHLREYSAGELRALLLDAGFDRVRFYAGARGTFIPMPFFVIAAVESLLDRLPFGLRKKLADNGPVRALLGLRVAALKD